jgi:hypothetical protein
MPRDVPPARKPQRPGNDGSHSAPHPMHRFTPEQLAWILGLALILLGLALYRMFFLL